MPRAAVLSIHARVKDTAPDTWADPALVQLWGPRFSVFAVAAADAAVFTIGRLANDPAATRRAVDTADRLEAFLAGREMKFGDAGEGLGVPHNSLRYGSSTGRLLLRWDGARQPTVRVVPTPDVDPRDAGAELVRRYLHVYGPGTPTTFANWAGVGGRSAAVTFDTIADELLGARTPVGDRWILAADEPSYRSKSDRPAAARLLPSGDSYWLLQGADRELLVPNAQQRPLLWTPRVWPGALLVGGEIAGTWRRAHADLVIAPWRVLTRAERIAVETEAATLPLPGLDGQPRISWDS
jgi:winged helix DNA-binding protein